MKWSARAKLDVDDAALDEIVEPEVSDIDMVGLLRGGAPARSISLMVLWLSWFTVMAGVSKPWPARNVRDQRDCCRPLASATSSASHEEVVLIFCEVDFV